MDFEQYYEEYGSDVDPDLILLHGNGEDLTYFENQIEALSAHYHLYLVDTRGHGRSTRGQAPFTIAQFAQDLKEFMDRHLIQKAHILGFSDGANIAMKFALRYPAYVQTLILNGGNLDSKGVKPLVQLPITLGYYLTGPLKKARSKHELLGLMVEDQHLQPAALKRIRRPVLVIAGTKDMIKESHTRFIAELIPQAQLEIIPGSHFVARENPKDFNREVLAFLERNN